MTAQLQSTLQSLEPALQAKLADLIQEREADVETMRSRTTPWKTLIREEADKEEKDGLATTRIERVDGLRTDDELARIERWAEEVVSACSRYDGADGRKSTSQARSFGYGRSCRRAGSARSGDCLVRRSRACESGSSQASCLFSSLR